MNALSMQNPLRTTKGNNSHGIARRPYFFITSIFFLWIVKCLHGWINFHQQLFKYYDKKPYGRTYVTDLSEILLRCLDNIISLVSSAEILKL